uniref:Uncharacterized protein n=1 Tax=Octopus bimaculoides TaxID=37653 RepID=A0A0L8FQ21_OCTBM
MGCGFYEEYGVGSFFMSVVCLFVFFVWGGESGAWAFFLLWDVTTVKSFSSSVTGVVSFLVFFFVPLLDFSFLLLPFLSLPFVSLFLPFLAVLFGVLFEEGLHSFSFVSHSARM